MTAFKHGESFSSGVAGRTSSVAKRVERLVAWGVFALLFATYILTVAPTVSYWDCPEYVSAAYLLEVGHPPGNPLWMLVERVITLLAPPQYAALAVNLSSGLFMALAAMLLARIIYQSLLWILAPMQRRGGPNILLAAAGAAVGALSFGWSDSAWYSAVEAEVYAMSTFMTALCVWLMVKWAAASDGSQSRRLLVLIAYLFGLSIGIHQLNLLCIPALAAIWTIKRNIRTPWKLLVIFLLSLVGVGFVLLIVMPGSIAVAARCELFAVNTLHLPYLSGVLLYILATGAVLILLLYLTDLWYHRSLRVNVRRLNLLVWMFAMLLAGYSCYALIPVRGAIPSPANATMPGEPFSFAAYQAREQYGSAPLFYGPTSYARPMYQEQFDSDGNPQYFRYALQQGEPIIAPYEPGARVTDPLAMLSPSDSLSLANAEKAGRDAYVTVGYRFKPKTTPELNMFLPRITGRKPADIEGYESWIGMTQDRMVRVPVSEAYDSLGNAVTRLDSNGNRTEAFSYRPTYLQNAEWLASYQIGYMYLRYLMWNFAGRQNDIPSQGEVQHGNFITGFPALDHAMLGPDELLPAEEGHGNPGHNRYWMLPFLLGILGIFWSMAARRRGRRACITVGILFVMTGIAIVLYLNQGPGEPRERDYSFLGSFMAFAIWIGYGTVALARICRSPWALTLPVATVCWMCYENWDDHDRSGRYAAREVTVSIMESLEPDAIIFVDGDNFTFPLWYIQEVEGVRRDVRVVNTAYLRVPAYAANLLKQWRESAPLPMTQSRGDIVWGANRLTRVGSGREVIDAVTLLDSLRHNPDCTTASRFARIGKDYVYDLTKLSVSGQSSSIDVGRLMMFDIIATNAVSEHPRPIYWMRNIKSDGHIRIPELQEPWLYGTRLNLNATDRHRSKSSADRLDSISFADIMRVLPPNRRHQDVYIDRAPALQIASLRFAIVAATHTLLEHGKIAEAEQAVRRADLLIGEHPETYRNFSLRLERAKALTKSKSGVGREDVERVDTLLNTRLELARLLEGVADSIEARPEAVSERVRLRTPELRARARTLRLREATRDAARRNYRRALPPRLLPALAPPS